MSRVTEGTGLGLAISEKLAHAMGGEIERFERAGIGIDLRLLAFSLEEVEQPLEVYDAA